MTKNNEISLADARELLLELSEIMLGVVESLGRIGSIKVYVSDEGDDEPYADVVAYDMESRRSFGFHHDFKEVNSGRR